MYPFLSRHKFHMSLYDWLLVCTVYPIRFYQCHLHHICMQSEYTTSPIHPSIQTQISVRHALLTKSWKRNQSFSLPAISNVLRHSIFVRLRSCQKFIIHRACDAIYSFAERSEDLSLWIIFIAKFLRTLDRQTDRQKKRQTHKGNVCAQRQTANSTPLTNRLFIRSWTKTGKK